MLASASDSETARTILQAQLLRRKLFTLLCGIFPGSSSMGNLEDLVPYFDKPNRSAFTFTDNDPAVSACDFLNRETKT